MADKDHDARAEIEGEIMRAAIPIAQRMAFDTVRNFYRAKRITTCAFCLSTGTLRRRPDGILACGKHLEVKVANYEEVQKAAEPATA